MIAIRGLQESYYVRPVSCHVGLGIAQLSKRCKNKNCDAPFKTIDQNPQTQVHAYTVDANITRNFRAMPLATSEYDTESQEMAS